MQRSPSALGDREFDLAVVGGGIFGICAAYEAATRGLSVALVERGDFSGATSANCFKVVHGGLRYLQHGDLFRVRQSVRERSALLRIAPHLVSPLPIMVPTYGAGMRGKGLLRAGLLAYDLLTFDKNRGIADKQRRIPSGATVSAEECFRQFPGIERNGLTGGVVFHDGQMYSPPRLALSILKSAVGAGTVAANYVEALGYVRKGSRVAGIRVRDAINGDVFEIRSKQVINAAGPWAERLNTAEFGLRAKRPIVFSRDAAIILKRPLTHDYALAVEGATRDPDAIFSRGNRHLFLVPWRGYTLLGVWHAVYRGDPDEVRLTEEEVGQFLDEFNDSYALGDPLSLNDVSTWNFGLTLFGDNEDGAEHLSYGKQSRILNHADENGTEGLITVVGVRYTMGRGTAEQAINMVLRNLGRNAPRSRSADMPVSGGDIEDFDDFVRSAMAGCPEGITSNSMGAILRNHGSEYKSVMKYASQSPAAGHVLGASNTIEGEVMHAVREEMACKLADVVLRRTDLGTGEYPGEDALMRCAAIMADELGWDQARVQREMEDTNAEYPSFVVNRGREASVHA